MNQNWIEITYGRRARRSLEDIVRFADDAAHLVARGRESYDADKFLQLAAEAVMHRIGEAVARLPDAFVDAFSDLRLRQVKAMRNLIAHEYDNVNPDLLWATIQVRVPELRRSVRVLLERSV